MIIIDTLYGLLEFIDKGGQVMWLIALLAFILWSLVFERLWYFFSGLQSELAKSTAERLLRHDRVSSRASFIRNAAIARLNQKIGLNLGLIKTLVLLCPLLGLLGTVSGMIGVFDVIAFTSMGDVQLMANGVSRATIPTMASLVISISGLFAHRYLLRKAEQKKLQVWHQFEETSHA